MLVTIENPILHPPNLNHSKGDTIVYDKAYLSQLDICNESYL